MSDTNTAAVTTPKKSEWKERELGALWLKGEGEKMRATGSVKMNGQEVQIVMFRERNKKSPNSPDYRIYLSNPPQKVAAPVENTAPAAKPVAEDVPF